ncbi:MAG: hypothetical protein M3P11_00500 [Actinomycetota bacterium]|nr:hypothetical protein [Actinomycetota bacterium]
MKRATTTTGRRALLPIAVLLVAVGCAKGATTTGDPTAMVSTTPGTPGARVWIAVFAVADDPDALDPETTELSPILGSAIRVSPVQCFHGLPPEAGTGYVIGAVADTREGLDALVVRTGKDPMLEKEVGEFCLD